MSPDVTQRLAALCMLVALELPCRVVLGRDGTATRPAGVARLEALALSIDAADVDLASGQLIVRLSRPAAKVTLKVLGISGQPLAQVEQAFDGVAAGSPLTLHWSIEAAPAEAVARIEVFGHDTSGYYKGLAITPWSFSIPHEDVAFETDSAVVRASEAGKLRASLRLIQKELPKTKALGPVSLFILAHTDSVGTAEYNDALSTRRARSIAEWFRRAGLRIPIAYDGMGERALKVQTANEVDEARNRRADYMLGIDPPRFKGSGAAPAWQRF